MGNKYGKPTGLTCDEDKNTHFYTNLFGCEGQDCDTKLCGACVRVQNDESKLCQPCSRNRVFN